jgi:hypothetical protein
LSPTSRSSGLKHRGPTSVVIPAKAEMVDLSPYTKMDHAARGYHGRCEMFRALLYLHSRGNDGILRGGINAEPCANYRGYPC